MSKQEKIDKAVSIMQDNYDDKADFYYNKENNVIAINPTDEAFEEEMVDVLDGDESKHDWHKLTDSIDELSITIYDNLHIKTSIAIVKSNEVDDLINQTSQKVAQIPPEKQTLEKRGLIMKSIENSQYSLDSEKLREMFANIISRAANKDYVSSI